jgi:D-alanyl-D-alanine dipeptidase
VTADILLLSDPAVAAVPIVDNGEPLVDLRCVNDLRVDPRKHDGDGAFAHARAGVAEQLLAAQAALPHGLRLLVVECYRPPALQQRYFSEYRAELATSRPDAEDSTLDVLASRYISPIAVAPHCTGGAVDLTLCTLDGEELDLGTAVNASPEESDGGCYTGSPLITGQARDLREALLGAMIGAGFVNYPTEWWHYSAGERYWAAVTRATSARYGPANPSYADLKSQGNASPNV